MPGGWKKNYKYFNRDLEHNEYQTLKNNFRIWKKEKKLQDNLQPFGAEYKGLKKFVPPKDTFNGLLYSPLLEQTKLSLEDESKWTLYLSKWKQNKSNQTFRHKGCRPNCGTCYSYKLYKHGKNVNGNRKYKNFKIFIDNSIKTPKEKCNYNQGPYYDCVVCYDKKPNHVMVRLSCGKQHSNNNYICIRCREEIYMSDYNTCPMCRNHSI